MDEKKALIIGGGPAGLTAAYEFLEKTNIKPIVIEMSPFWGGISRTEEQNGNRIDIGGHRFFSKSNEVMDWWQQIMPIYKEGIEDSENVLLVRNRKSRIYYNKHFFNYPVSISLDTVLKLGFFNTILIVFSYAKSLLFPLRKVETLEDFFINRFGKRLYKTFFKDYTEKVWGVPCTEIPAEWGAQRIKGLSIFKSILYALKKTLRLNKKNIAQKDTETSLIEYFLYPKYGPGQMWDLVADKISKKGGELKQNSKVIGLNFKDNSIKSVEIKNMLTGDVETIHADYFISSMPVNELINSFEIEVPKNVKTVSDGLPYRDFITVGLLLDKINYKLDDNWIYIQENYVEVGRLQIFNNWSPYMVKNKDYFWVGLEYFCNVDDKLWRLKPKEMLNLAIDEMIKLGFINAKENVLDHKIIKVPKAYPAYFGTYSKFDVIKDYVDQFSNLFLIGRNGMHRYNNQDHSMLTAIKTVQVIDKQNLNKDEVWEINTEEEYHEEK